MFYSAFLKSWESFDVDSMYTIEDVQLNLEIVSFQTPDQRFYFLSLGASSSIVTDRAVFGKPACTLDEFQLIIGPPGQDIFFPMNHIEAVFLKTDSAFSHLPLSDKKAHIRLFAGAKEGRDTAQLYAVQKLLLVYAHDIH